jgi:hypothetical protein
MLIFVSFTRIAPLVVFSQRYRKWRMGSGMEAKSLDLALNLSNAATKEPVNQAQSGRSAGFINEPPYPVKAGTMAEAVGQSVVALETIGDDAGAGLSRAADKITQMRRGGGRQDGDAGTAGDEAALLDALAPGLRSGQALARRGWDRFDGDRHQALVRIGTTAAAAFGLTATTIVALVDLQ